MGQLPKHFCSGGSACSGTNHPCRFASGAQLSPASRRTQLQGLMAQIWGRDELQGRKGGAPYSSSLRLFLSLCVHLETVCVPPKIPQGAAQSCSDSPGMLPEHHEIHPPFLTPAGSFAPRSTIATGIQDFVSLEPPHEHLCWWG